MTEQVHPNVTRVVEAARAKGLDISPRRFPDGTKTAADAAAAIGVDIGQIVKSLIFAVDGEVVLAYVSGANQLDEKKLALAAGGLKCSRVDADVVRETTGFPIGGGLATAGVVYGIGSLGDQSGDFDATALGAGVGFAASMALARLLLGPELDPPSGMRTTARWATANLIALLPAIGASVGFNATPPAP